MHHCRLACAPADAACQRECWTSHRAELVKSEYMACRQRECSGICGADQCFGDYNYFDAPDEACRACQNLHCCSSLTACWHDVECVDGLECFDSCPDVECMLDECNNAEHQPYLLRLAPIWACRNEYCYAECEDSDDDCSVVFALTGTCAE
jgi:hypothetical protein